jgi:UDP-N-acetyl-D-galactosamine dehydrogenase
MIHHGGPIKEAAVNILGLTFKEDCSDLRNSRVIDVIDELNSYGVRVCVHDPVLPGAEARREYDIDPMDWDELPVADAVIVAVAHQEFIDKPIAAYTEKLIANGCFVDVKSRFDADELRRAGVTVWRP